MILFFILEKKEVKKYFSLKGYGSTLDPQISLPMC